MSEVRVSCAGCGREIWIDPRCRQKYCPDCAAEAARKSKREYARRQYGKKSGACIPEARREAVYICRRCGKEQTAESARAAARSFYCPDCRRTVRLGIARESKRRRREREAREKEQAGRKGPAVSIADVLEYQKKHGIASYGQAVRMMEKEEKA